MYQYFIIKDGKPVISEEDYLLIFTSYNLAERFSKGMEYENYSIKRHLTEKEALKRSFNIYKTNQEKIK